MDLPCRADPEKWFARAYGQLGEAIHGCLVHCPRLAECRTDPPVIEGVIGGVLYTKHEVPNHYQPEEVKCAGCTPKPQLHGTEGGYSRHRRANEPVCTPCRNAHNAGAARRRRPKPPAPVPPPADVFEERRRVLVEAMKKTA
jgi:hypothetical protein